MRFGVLVLSLSVLLMSGCMATLEEKEELKRANASLQDVKEMIKSKQLPTVEFEFNSATILKDSYPTLDKIAAIAISGKNLKLVIEGHCDDVGSDAYNDELSLARAKAVKQYLVSKGVYPDYVRVYGYGKRKPVIPGNSPKARALNRRVEFILTTRNWASVY